MIKVLLADDHCLVREALRNSLAQEPDIEIIGEAGDAPTTFERTHSLKPDVVVLDVSLPDVNGIDVASDLKEGTGVDAKIVALSMHADRFVVTEMLRAGAVAYVTKSSSRDELVTAIRVAAAGSARTAMLHDGSEYRGNYGLDVDALVAFHRPRLAVLASAGADLLACETLPCRDEAVALARLLPEFPQMQAWISFSCRDGVHVSQGEPLAACVDVLEGCVQVAAVGVNCTAPRYIASLVEIAALRTAKPSVVYQNSGERYDAAAMRWHGGVAATTLAEEAREWHRLDARLIGGCCRTTPADIRALRT